jgi:hypothetical protein
MINLMNFKIRHGSGPESSPNFVPSQVVAILESCNIELRSLPYISGQYLGDVFLRLLHSDGSFQPIRIDPQQIRYCIIVVSNSGVSFLFPERSSRFLPFVGLSLAVVGSFLSSQSEDRVPSVALLLQSHGSFLQRYDKNLVNGIKLLSGPLLPELRISSTSHENSLAICNNTTLSLCNTFTALLTSG